MSDEEQEPLIVIGGARQISNTRTNAASLRGYQMCRWHQNKKREVTIMINEGNTREQVLKNAINLWHGD